MVRLIESQQQITEVYQELTYDELKDVLQGWLNPDAEADESSDEVSTSTETLSSTASDDVEVETTDSAPFEVEENPKSSNKKLDDVASAFDDLFSS